MDLSEYLLIDAAVRDRLGDLRRARSRTQAPEARSKLAKVLYIASVLRARPRAIDHYIDYFGDQAPRQPRGRVVRLKLRLDP